MNHVRDTKHLVDIEDVPVASSDDQSAAYNEADFNQRLSKAIEELPPKQRLTLLMKVKDGKRHQEIADVLGCAVGTSKANYHNAILNLRRALSDLLPSPEGQYESSD